ncbi:MAG: hypothetical protein LIP03_04060 [Bacteroidales bacterium]|nr:hypothetical protein [Bacteroidales bacterium]
MKKKSILSILALLAVGVLFTTGFYTKPAVSAEPAHDDNHAALSIYEHYLELAEQANQVALASLLDTTEADVPTDIFGYCLSLTPTQIKHLCAASNKWSAHTPMCADVPAASEADALAAREFVRSYIAQGGHNHNYILRHAPRLQSPSLNHLMLAIAACYDGITSRQSASDFVAQMSTVTADFALQMGSVLASFFTIAPSDYSPSSQYLASQCEVSIPALIALQRLQ